MKIFLKSLVEIEDLGHRFQQMISNNHPLKQQLINLAGLSKAYHHRPSFPNLSHGIKIEIFKYLDDISLLRSKQVCKEWKSIVEESFVEESFVEELFVDESLSKGLYELPTEIKVEIFKGLCPEEQKTCRLVCSEWRDVIDLFVSVPEIAAANFTSTRKDLKILREKYFF